MSKAQTAPAASDPRGGAGAFPARAYAAQSAASPLAPATIHRRSPGLPRAAEVFREALIEAHR